MSVLDQLGVELEVFSPAASRQVVAGIMFVSSMVEGQGEREVVCRGMVMLHMSDTLWVVRCQVMVRQPTLGTHSRLSPGWLERGLPPTTGTSWSCCTKWLTRLAFPDKTWRSSYGGHRAVSGAAQGGGHSPGG